MAKKVKNSKKHQLKYSQPVSSVSAASSSISGGLSAKPFSGLSARGTVVSGQDFKYVSRDVYRLALFVGFLVLLELTLWYLMNHTGLGDVINKLITV